MTYTSQVLTTLTPDTENDILDASQILPVLQEIDTVLADLKARIEALEAPAK